MNLHNLSTNLDSSTWASFKRFQPFSSKFFYSVIKLFCLDFNEFYATFYIISEFYHQRILPNFNFILRNLLVPWIYWNHSSNKVCMEWSKFDGGRFGECMVHERTPPSKFTIIFCTAFATWGQIGCCNIITHLPCPAKCFLFVPMCNSN